MRTDQSGTLLVRKQTSLRDTEGLNAMGSPHANFPIAEGLGIFVGVVAWDLLADGHLEIIKALLIAVPCSLIWFGFRRWREKHKNEDRNHGH
jgi:hypothetical protein